MENQENLLEHLGFQEQRENSVVESNLSGAANKISTVDEIEQKILLSNGSSTDLIQGINDLEISKKKKKRRRKPRTKKVIKEINPPLELIDYSQNPLLAFLNTFKITAVSNQTTGKVLRIKNGNLCQHINTKFLLSVLNKSPLLTYAAPPTNNLVATSEYDSVYGTPGKSSVKIKTGTKSKDPQDNNSRVTDKLNLQSTSADSQCASASTSNSPKQKKRERKEKKQKKFLPYWPSHKVLEGLQKKELFEGILRINQKHFREAYVNNEDRTEQDYLIPTVIDRNRALEGDRVAIKVKPKVEWTEKQKTACVVSILEKVHSRIGVGSLQLSPDKNKNFALFIPRDWRVPKIRIPMSDCPSSFYQHPNRYENILFKAKILSWDEIKHAIGTIVDNVGSIGDLESESNAILAENGLDVAPIPPILLQFTRMTDTIPPIEYQYRKDFRKECVFTIDPLTARDLDDAVSCKQLDNGNFEIGVHISDVAYYLLEDTVLDKIVCKKATTVYLVNNVYHMLPRELCFHCSLLPGCDKLAFSVIWEMTKTGEIVNHYFTRSVINSCAQLAYEDAQKMIENPDYEFAEDELPEIHGGFTYKDLSGIVNHLQGIAVNLRRGRFNAGALRIDQTKLLFRIDEVTGEPTNFFVYENKEAHRLIEEFMLLANITVAKKIVKDFPQLAFLRRHDPPNPRLLDDLQKKLREYGVKLDISSSKALQMSMRDLENKPYFDKPQLMVLNHLLAKPMTRALYFCAANAQEYEHYALHVPIYTHFTSPIRRYADIMVHRLLAASLGYTEKPNWSINQVMGIANNCNKQKYSAKIAGEVSSELYLAHYVGEHQPFIQDAVVIDVRNNFFDVLVVATGTIFRLYINNLGDVECTVNEDEPVRKFLLTFPETFEALEEHCVIQLFSVVKVSLQRKSKTFKLEAKLLRPVVSQSFTSNTSKRL